MERARPAGPADADRLAEVCDEALAEVTASRGGPQLAHSVLDGRSVPEALCQALADPATLVVAGELNGVILGVGIVHTADAGGPATIDVLYVEQAARGVGLGEAIMDVMAGWAAERGCSGVDATALPGSREAKAFFESHGMVARALVMHRRFRR